MRMLILATLLAAAPAIAVAQFSGPFRANIAVPVVAPPTIETVLALGFGTLNQQGTGNPQLALGFGYLSVE